MDPNDSEMLDKLIHLPIPLFLTFYYTALAAQTKQKCAD
jgi:hypothetical protein